MLSVVASKHSSLLGQIVNHCRKKFYSICPWNDVPEADGAEGDEAEVAAVQEPPPLPLAKEECPSTDVGHLVSLL